MTDTAAVASWYDANADGEHGRLELFGLEYAMSLRAIMQCIDKIKVGHGIDKLEILDLGGGTGRYSVELARQGHIVHYTDLSPTEVEHGKSYADSEGVKLASATAVNALLLDQQPELFIKAKYDLVLCMGPLYHLLAQQEKDKVLRNCAHVSKPGGFVCVAFVTKWAHLRDIARRDPERLQKELEFYASYASNGQRSGIYDRVAGRTGWHVGSGREAISIVEGPGELELDRVIACEGFLGGGLSAGLGKDQEMSSKHWVDLCWLTADKEEMWGASDHLLVVARKKR